MSCRKMINVTNREFKVLHKNNIRIIIMNKITIMVQYILVVRDPKVD